MSSSSPLHSAYGAQGSDEYINRARRITVDDDFHCLGYSMYLPNAPSGDVDDNFVFKFPVCVKGIQSITEKAIMSPEGRRLDIEYDRVAAILGGGKAKHMGQVSAVEVVSFKWRDEDDYF